jgi:BlaI family transcriptional regulator, penicillinase repressor
MTKRREKKEALPSLSKAEWEIMKTFWEHGKQAARDVFAALPEGHGWAIKTVKTLLSRLVAKGALQYEQIGNSYLYHPVFSREQLTREEMKGFVDRVLDGSMSPVLMHFVEEAHLSDEEIAEIQHLLDKKGKRSRGEKRP